MPKKSPEERLNNALENFPDEGIPLQDLLNEIEWKLLDKALEKADGNQTTAAGLVGVKRTTFLFRHKTLNDK